jgi:hypothetical protein
MDVLKLILKRFASKLTYSLWSVWISFLVFAALLCVALYLLSPYECPVRRAVGLSLSRSDEQKVVTGFFEHPWEQDCEAYYAKP